MGVLNFILAGPVFGILILFLGVIWMLRDEKDKSRPLLVGALVLNLFYGFLLSTLMGREGGLVPWKFDHVLYHMDASLGVQTAAIAGPLQGFWRIPLWAIYQMMVPMMIVWFLVVRKRRLSGSIVFAYVAELVAGPLLYLIVPACGPIYAFGTQWLNPPAVAADAIRLTGLPNAFPSLHVGTAFVLVLVAPGKFWKVVASLFLAGTCLATLATGEHYVIDLIPGFTFGACAAAAGMLNFRRSAIFLSLTIAWSLAVRFGSVFLIAYPVVTRSIAVLTMILAAIALWKSWTESAPAASEASAAAAVANL